MHVENCLSSRTGYMPPVSGIAPSDFNRFSNLLLMNRKIGIWRAEFGEFAIYQITNESRISLEKQ